MKRSSAVFLLLAVIAAPIYAATAPGSDRPDTITAPSTGNETGKPANAEELSDAFLGDVSDGSKPAADGSRTEEESGDTMDQTLRSHTRNSW